MTDFSSYIILAAIVVFILCVYLAVRQFGKMRAERGRLRLVHNILSQAMEQRSAFDLKMLGADLHIGISATIQEIKSASLIMRSQQMVTSDWQYRDVEAYFRINSEDGPIFYVFDSTARTIKTGANESEFEIIMPQHLRVEKKRHFIRARPAPGDILMLAIWPIAPGRRLPRANQDLGPPLLSWKTGQEHADVAVDNISGSGIGLRFAPRNENAQPPFDIRKGRQLICLVVFRPEPAAQRPIVFYSTAEIMNSRKVGYALALGMEFTNWAVQEQGETEIHWAHNSPWRGIKPILEWVQRLDREQAASKS